MHCVTKEMVAGPGRENEAVWSKAHSTMPRSSGGWSMKQNRRGGGGGLDKVVDGRGGGQGMNRDRCPTSGIQCILRDVLGANERGECSGSEGLSEAGGAHGLSS